MSGDTPLYYAANIKNAEVARFLINSGASINEENGAGDTPLFCAAFEGC